MPHTYLAQTNRTRRHLLQAAAVAGLAPLLGPLLNRRARAATRPTRLLVIYHPNGLESGWQPVGGEADFRLSPTLAALEPHRRQLLILDGIRGGIRNEVQGHAQGMTSMWTGAQIPADGDLAGHASFDQIAAERLGVGTAFRSLELGVQTQPNGRIENTNVMIYAGKGKPLPAEDDPNRVYDRLFGAALADPTALARTRRHQGSVLDLVRSQLNEIGSHYGTEDRRLLEEHEASVRAFERRLDDLGKVSCPHPYTPHQRGDAAPARNTAFFKEMAALQRHLAVLALDCGLTRVVSLQYSNSVSDARIPGVNDSVTLHGTMHTRPRAEKEAINRYFVEEFAALLVQMQARKRADGTTLLDETLVVWGTEMAVGNHLNDPVPFILAGGGGAVETGRFTNLSEGPRHTRVLMTALAALGIEDVRTLGDLRGESDQGPIDRLRG